MKKIKSYIVLLFLMLFVSIPLVKADGISTSISGTGEIQAGEEFTLTLNAIGGTSIMYLEGNLNYDSNKLELVSSSSQSGFNLTMGSKLVVDDANGHDGSFAFAQLKFKAKAGFAINETTEVSFSNVSTSDGNSDTTGSGSSKTIKVLPPKSSNNYLSGLTVDVGTIKFNKSTNSYTITVENNVSKAKIEATLEDSTASLSGTGTKNLKVYKNTFNVIVTAENGTKRTYKVNIIRKDDQGKTTESLSEDTSLKTLTIAGLDNFVFDNTIYEYTIEVENDVENLDIEAIANNTGTTVKVNKPETLVVGDNTITIELTSASGKTSSYTLHITRKAKEEVKPAPIKENKCKECNNVGLYCVIVVLDIIMLASIALNIVYYRRLKGKKPLFKKNNKEKVILHEENK